MARTQPDPVVSRRVAPGEGGARGGGGPGGGAPSGYSSERGRSAAPSREGSSERGPPRDRAPRVVGGIQYTSCANCKAAYVMSADTLTAGGSIGSKVRCSVCKHVWFQKADRLNGLAPGLGLKDYPEERKEVIAAGGDFRQERAPMGDRPRGAPGADRRGGPGGERGSYASRGGGAAGGERRAYGGGGGERRGGRSNNKTTVFVGNLPFAASEGELRDLLTSKGAGVNKVTLVSDQDGRPKGFAFAEMATEADMRAVVDALDGASMGGRNVSVREGNK